MKHLGTIARGIRTPIIKAGDDLESIVFNSLLETQKQENIEFENQDIIAITEAVVSISENNYITVDQLANLFKERFKTDHIGILFPILSRNRFSLILKALARTFKKLTVMLSYPSDEVGNAILFESDLMKLNINPYTTVISRNEYEKNFSHFKHPFTGINMVHYYEELIQNENCISNIIFGNDPKLLLHEVKDILVSSIHRRDKDKTLLINAGANQVYDLTDIANTPSNEHGFNEDYGMLGSNQATKEKLKLFPNRPQSFVESLQKRIYEHCGKIVEVLIYGDGAFKDPVGHIWELADPVVSPAYTKGLEGSPNEVKLKYLSDHKFSHLKGDELANAIKKEIKNKSENNETEDTRLGTTPRKYTDLIGSLCDLMSGSGDKGTPVIWISNYFTNYSK